ncbi:DUF5626 family protein [Desemzia incerta]|uniref:DUF5626 family protein n=1 Tax=Desemzia incerta TaxID=82801 RepID=UPI003315E330
MKKIFFLLGCMSFFSFIITPKVYAGEAFSLPDNSVVYDIDQGGSQQFEVEDDLGRPYIITIEEEPQLLMMASSVKNGTYKITKERPLQWKASYKIDVSSNKITRAHSSSATAITGSFKSASLRVDSPTQATYYLKRTLLLVESSINLRAKLSNGNIVVTY